MIKTIPPGSFDFGVPATKFIKSASDGLYGNDLRTFIKRAGAKAADIMSRLSFAKGEVPIHLIAIGATEKYSCNRNFDGFTEDCCRTYHPTFVKHARWYRNHLNKDPKKSYGIVKESFYNEDMHRLELIVALNATKEAAERNGGLVADKEMEKLSNNEDIPCSMSCRIGYDVCSRCGNKARTRDDYCRGTKEGGACPGGGCKNNLGYIDEDGSITYVDNPHPTWFDISGVYKPADRIAYVLGRMNKSASNTVIGGAELAEQLGLTLPSAMMCDVTNSTAVKNQIKIACMLAEMEQQYKDGMFKHANYICDTKTAVDGLDKLNLSPVQQASLLKALAQEKIALSLSDFIQFTVKYSRAKADNLAEKIGPYLPGMFSRMCADPEQLAEDIANNQFKISSATPSDEWCKFAYKQSNSASLSLDKIQKRSWLQSINGLVKQANVTVDVIAKPSAEYLGIANAYGLYKLAFLNEIANYDPNFELTTNIVLRQNYIS